MKYYIRLIDSKQLYTFWKLNLHFSTTRRIVEPFKERQNNAFIYAPKYENGCTSDNTKWMYK